MNTHESSIERKSVEQSPQEQPITIRRLDKIETTTLCGACCNA